MTTRGDHSDELRGQADDACADSELPGLPSAELWLADGYNLLHCAPFRGDGEGAFWSAEKRERLVEIARRFPHPHVALWIVFDGPRENTECIAAGTEQSGEFQLTFAPSADDWIVRRVKEVSRHPDLEGRDPFGFGAMASVAVVSGDRKLGNRARHHGAAVVSPRHFLAHCRVGADLETP